MKTLNLQLCNVSGHITELLEICADDPKFHLVFIPGNPGIIGVYKDFLESLYELLGGAASITAIAHISHSHKDWEKGRLFSFQEQIDHKVAFIRENLKTEKVPIILIGHSVGSYISIEVLRKCPEKVMHCIGLYPFLALNPQSTKQQTVGTVAASSILSAAISLVGALVGMLPERAARFIASKTFASTWSDRNIDAATQLLKYHYLRNLFFMANSEFKKLSEPPDWTFIRQNKDKITFLFGDDDHWAPLEMLEEISNEVPGIATAVEREGHTHCFSCTKAGSDWVAKYTATQIRNFIM